MFFKMKLFARISLQQQSLAQVPTYGRNELGLKNASYYNQIIGLAKLKPPAAVKLNMLSNIRLK